MIIRGLLLALILTFSGCTYAQLQMAEAGISIGMDLHEYAREKREELKRIESESNNE